MSAARKIYALHQWLGLVAGMFILVFFLTGSIIVFRDELNKWENPHLFSVKVKGEWLPYDELYRKVQAQVPEVYLYSFRYLPASPEETIEMRVYSQDTYPLLYVNPYTADVLGIENNSWYDFFITLHYTFYLKTTGELLAALFAMALLGSVITGIYVYRKSVVKVVLFRVGIHWKNWRTVSSGLHRIVGVWALLFNLVLATSGFYMMWYALDPGYHTQTAKTTQIQPPPAIHANIDSLMKQTQQLIPGVQLTYVDFPRNSGDSITIHGHLPGGWLLGKMTSYAKFDPHTGQVGSVFKETELSIGEKIEYALYTLHYGQYGGKAIKVVYAFFGLAGALLTITGFLLWWRRKAFVNKKKKGTSLPMPRYTPKAQY
ncbi:PepSY-associated TM helix domain-containing protein [Rhodocytophaga aerolata]|uniref:PepSY-associated TM helix domain-containing protein n=1 Tax=Rhodocytophaga aerolata TaxID=455078 RepID=A0ABT8R4J6_9BACT|nr:PepSY-associated TM helix domain-containing protein [Rhodocytophaga aerolata]MDO1447016.1 PepSY-associated TM helix domain-containing protein [Rhodocytophaga aerolata]